MIKGILTGAALVASLGIGVGLVVFAQSAGDRTDPQNETHSITGITSGAAGTDSTETDLEGVQQIQILPAPTRSDNALQDATESSEPQTQAVDLQGIKGTDGTGIDQENIVEIIKTTDGSIQSIRGIKGIDTVVLQNLETVLRMQEPPPPPEDGGGSVRSAAALLTMEDNEEYEPEEVVDGRDEHLEFELEGS